MSAPAYSLPAPPSACRARGAPDAAGVPAEAPGACQKFSQQRERETPRPAEILVSRHVQRLRRLRRAVQISAAEHVGALPPGFRWQAKFVTLTYRQVGDWSPSHVRDYLQRLRVWLRRRSVDLRYVWVAELQRRGAVHYHLVVWVPFGLKLPLPDASGMWPHGLSNIEDARHPVAYLVKYASKGTPDGQAFPCGLRTHGFGGLPPLARLARSFAMLPRWLQAAGLHRPQRVTRLRGGLYRLEDTGELVRSPWEIVEHASNWSWVRLRLRSVEVVAGGEAMQTD